MMENEKLLKRQFAIKLAITYAVLLVLSFLVMLFTYDFKWTLTNISNSLFIVNAPIFFVALIIQTGASRATLAVSYTARTWFAPKSTKDQFDNYQEYYDEKAPGHQKDVKHIIIATISLMFVAFIIARIIVDTRPNM